MDTVGGCYIKLIIIALVIAYLTTVISQPSLFLGWFGIGKWGDAYYDKDGMTTEEQARFDSEIEDFFSTAKQKLNLKIKNLLNEYLELDKRFDKISNEIKNMNKTCNINQQNINIQNETYNKFIENKNLLIEINSQIQDIDFELFQLKKDIILEYFDGISDKKFTSFVEECDYYNSGENKELCKKFNSCCTMTKDMKIKRSDERTRTGNSTHKVLIIPEDLSENVKNLEINLNTLVIEIEKEITNIITTTENATPISTTCWYIIGTAEELEKLNVVRQKSLLKWNFGATLNDEGMFDKRRFFEGDKTKISKILIPNGYNSYEILTDMPSESYSEHHDHIEIKDPNKFWSNTNFLVILLTSEKKEYN